MQGKEAAGTGSTVSGRSTLGRRGALSHSVHVIQTNQIAWWQVGIEQGKVKGKGKAAGTHTQCAYVVNAMQGEYQVAAPVLQTNELGCLVLFPGHSK